MKGKIRRLLAMALAVVMTVGMMPMNALADEIVSDPIGIPGTGSTTYAASDEYTIEVDEEKEDINYNTGGYSHSYSTSNSSVATVNGRGVVTGKSVGTATITHTWLAGWTKNNETFSITVIPATTKYKVKWYIDGRLDKTTTVPEGEKPVYGETPEYTGAYGTKFLGWATETVTSKNVSYAPEAELRPVTSDVSYYAVFKADAYFYFVLPGKSSTSEKTEDYMYAGKGSIIVPDGQSGRWFSNDHSIGDYIIDQPSDAAIREGLSTYYNGSNGRDKYEDTWTYTIDWAALSVAGSSVGYDYEKLCDNSDFHIDTSITVEKIEEATIMYTVSEPNGLVNQSTMHQKDTNVDINKTVTGNGAIITTDGYSYLRTMYYNNATYTFDGWYTDSSYTTKAPDSITVTESKHYYARYISTPVKLIYNANGGTFSDGSTANKEVQAQRGRLTTLITPPTWEGYEFAGWTRSDGQADLAATEKTFTMPDGDLTLTAKWTPLKAAYTVERYQENLNGTYSRVERVEGLVGQIGREVTATAKTYTGFTKTNHSDSKESGVVLADGSLVLKVYYARDLYTITTSVTNGTITPTNNAVKFEDDATVTYTPNPGYKLESITVDGVALTEEKMNAASGSYTFEAVEANHSIKVVYVRDIDEFRISSIETKYDGQSRSLTFTGVARNGERKQYSLGGGTWQDAADMPEWKDVTAPENNPNGTRVQVRVVDKDNNVIWSDNTYVIITPRQVTLTSATDSKPYDGTPLTNDEVTIGGEGFVKGEGATYSVTGSQLDKGSSKNTFGYTLNDGTKAENYEITKTEGDLTVDAISTPITVTAADDSKTYDGSALTAARYTSNAKGILVTGDKLKVAISGTQTDAGSSENVVTSVRVVRGEGDAETDVTANYTFGTHQNGTLRVDKRKVTLTSATATKPYDGTALTNDTVTVTEGSFVSGEGATYTVTGSQLDAGNSKNTFDYTLNSGTKAGNYEITKVEGDLIVKQSEEEIVITAGDASKVYDGTAIANSSSTYTGKLVTGDELLVTVQGEAKEGENLADVGTYANKVVSYRVMRGETDVTDNYKFGASVDGTLTVTKRPVTLTSGSAEREYNGQPLTKDVVIPSTGVDAGFVGEEGLESYETTGSQLGEGSSKNTFTYELKENTKAGNYDITKVEGDLTVTKVPVAITITADSNSKMYDGTALTDDGFTFTPNVLKEGDALTAVVEGSITDYSGTGTANVVRSWKVMNGTTDVTSSYTFNTSVNGTLTITKRPVTLTSATDSKPYDGTPLTNDEVTVGDKGFADGEGATYSVTGSQLDKGESDNTFTYTLNDGTKAENYEITKTEGKLTVDAISTPITVTAKDGDKVYDGQPLEEKGVTYTSGVLLAGDKLVVTVEGSQTDAGESENRVTGVKVVRESDGKDVTSNYTMGTHQKGILTVNKRPLTVTAGNATKVYDETELTTDVYDIEEFNASENRGLVKLEGQDVKVTVDGSQTLVGTSSSFIVEEDFQILDKNNKDLTGNYEIEFVEGVLEVTDIGVDAGKVITKTNDQPEAGYKIGETVEFTISVTNIFDKDMTVTLKELENVIFGEIEIDESVSASERARANWKNAVSKILGKNEKSIAIAKGTTKVITASYVITEADALAGGFANTASVILNGNTYEGKNEAETAPVHTLTIYYLYSDGTTAAPTVERVVSEGQTYAVTSPTINGYNSNPSTVTGTMPKNDMVVTVVYSAPATPGTPPTPPTPPTEPDPTVVPDTPVPVGPGPDPIEVVVPTELVPVDDEDVPLQGAQIDVDEDGNVTVTPIDEEEIPLAGGENDEHACCILHFLLMLAALIIYTCYTSSMKKHQKKLAELKDQLGGETLKKQPGITDARRAKM